MATKRMNEFKKRIERNKTNHNRPNRLKIRPVEAMYDVIVIVRNDTFNYPSINLETVRDLRRSYQQEQVEEVSLFLVRSHFNQKIHELSYAKDD